MERVNLEQMNEIIKSGRTFVMFSAEWCGECKMNTPMIEDIEKNVEGTKFVKIDVDENELWNEDQNSDFNIMSVPTFMVFNENEETSRTEGFASPEKIKEIVRG